MKELEVFSYKDQGEILATEFVLNGGQPIKQFIVEQTIEQYLIRVKVPSLSKEDYNVTLEPNTRIVYITSTHDFIEIQNELKEVYLFMLRRYIPKEYDLERSVVDFQNKFLIISFPRINNDTTTI